MKRNWLISVLAVFIIITLRAPYGNGAKILGFFSAPSKSHLIIHISLMNELANRGHEVTIVTRNTIPGKLNQNIRNILIPINIEQFDEQLKAMMKHTENEGFSWSRMYGFLQNITLLNEDTLIHPEFLKIKNDHFDLVIIGWFLNDYHVGLGAHFKAPVIWSATIKPQSNFRNLIGMSSGVSYNSSPFLNYKGVMTFWQRLINFIAISAESLLLSGFEYFWYEPYYAKNFPNDKYPSYDEAKKNVSLILVNTHFSEGSLEAYLPGMVQVGGMHIKSEPKLLPKDTKDWLDGASDGAIFFSLGSNMKSTFLSTTKQEAMLRSFSKLKQRVLWKWEDDQLPNKPDNVMISKWFPQNDILAHPNVKLFISHCGLGSVNEAKCHGVPILGTPIFGDQPMNLEKIENEGWAVGCPLNELTEETFTTALNEILHNQTYLNKIKKISNLYRDRPQHPLDKAVYWVEYVIRYKGAKHMQSPAVYLNFVQYHSLDVIGFIVLLIYVIWKIVKFALCAIYQKCCKSKSKLKND